MGKPRLCWLSEWPQVTLTLTGSLQSLAALMGEDEEQAHSSVEGLARLPSFHAFNRSPWACPLEDRLSGRGVHVNSASIPNLRGTPLTSVTAPWLHSPAVQSSSYPIFILDV